MSMIEEQVRRIVFNLVGCNQDDHVKNFSFIMDRAGNWKPSPAYDLCHAEGSDFTRNHQLTLNGKWTLASTHEDISIVSTNDTHTVLLFNCRHGMDIRATLQAAR